MEWLKGAAQREGYKGKDELGTYQAPTLSEDDSSDSDSNLSWDPKDIGMASPTSPPAAKSPTRRDYDLGSKNDGLQNGKDGSPAVLAVSVGPKAFSCILPDLIPPEIKTKGGRFKSSSAAANWSVYKAFDEFGFVKEEDETVAVVPSGVMKNNDDQRLRWLAHFEFTENVDVGSMSWAKASHCISGPWLSLPYCCPVFFLCRLETL
eukprot:m.19481 g.19481  ORF g.19481 m.19481 type:complete len:206 (+) comp27847_c0_seq2:42-659(+)